MRILVDLDGICSDIFTPWLKLHNDLNGTSLTVADIVAWDQIPQSLIEYEGFFAELKPLPGAVEGVEALRSAGHKVTILSAPAEHKSSAGDKIDWCVRELGISRKDVILAHHKELVTGDVLIDDSPGNVKKWKSAHPTGTVLTIAYPYNKDVEHCIRFDGWQDTAKAWLGILQAVWHLGRR